MSTLFSAITPSYYDTLVEWELLEEALSHVAEHEQERALETLMYTLDCVVLETALAHLHESLHHEFLDLCSLQHHEPSILNWLEDRTPGVSQKIRVVLIETKSALIAELQQQL